MIHWALWTLAGLLLAGVVHLGTVLMLPRTATLDSYARLAPIAPVNTVAPVPPASAENALVPFTDPAFVAAVCRYDLSAGPLKLTAPVTPAYTSVTFYNRRGVAYYALNDRAAGRRVIELDLMTEQQKAELPEEEDVTAADRLIVESPTPTGLIVLRALAPEPGMVTRAQEVLAQAKCQVQAP